MRRTILWLLLSGAAMLIAGACAPAAAPTPSAVTTSSGLQYVEVQAGTGEAPKVGDVISVNYTGTLQSNNQVFDSSYQRNEPIKFALGRGQVIPGWDEGIALMKVGGKARGK